jgi:phospholipase C
LGKDEAKSRGVYQFTGALSVITRSANARKPDELPVERAPRPNVAAIPIPARPGEPSVFKHVVYVLKENRTYDQVYGDMPKGDGDPSLCIYGERVTPNQHAIAGQFALLDNYYCNGVLSADGHSWSTEGNATTYFERTFGGWTRSYPYGDDPLAISSTGHIWDAVLDKGLSFKNYGEYDYADPTKGESYKTILQDFESGERKVRFKHNIGIERLKRYSDPDCPGWNMGIPDVVRASYFIRDVKAGKLSAFNFVYLPQDHTSGGGAGSPTPEAHMADNDLAVGRIVDAVSHSKYWKDTVFFMVEDDPQAGFDHVDGHRSTCLVVSAYTRRGAVVSQFYNQGSVLKSISHILGLKPVTRTEIQANLMTDCFSRQPNFAVFDVRPNQVPLDQMNGAKSAFRRLDLSKPDRVDEQEFNRQLWTLSGRTAPFPVALTGPHGKGLAARGLRGAASEPDRD